MISRPTPIITIQEKENTITITRGNIARIYKPINTDNVENIRATINGDNSVAFRVQGGGVSRAVRVEDSEGKPTPNNRFEHTDTKKLTKESVDLNPTQNSTHPLASGLKSENQNKENTQSNTVFISKIDTSSVYKSIYEGNENPISLDGSTVVIHNQERYVVINPQGQRTEKGWELLVAENRSFEENIVDKGNVYSRGNSGAGVSNNNLKSEGGKDSLPQAIDNYNLNISTLRKSKNPDLFYFKVTRKKTGQVTLYQGKSFSLQEEGLYIGEILVERVNGEYTVSAVNTNSKSESEEIMLDSNLDFENSNLLKDLRKHTQDDLNSPLTPGEKIRQFDREFEEKYPQLVEKATATTPSSTKAADSTFTSVRKLNCLSVYKGKNSEPKNGLHIISNDNQKILVETIKNGARTQKGWDLLIAESKNFANDTVEPKNSVGAWRSVGVPASTSTNAKNNITNISILRKNFEDENSIFYFKVTRENGQVALYQGKKILEESNSLWIFSAPDGNQKHVEDENGNILSSAIDSNAQSGEEIMLDFVSLPHASNQQDYTWIKTSLSKYVNTNAKKISGFDEDIKEYIPANYLSTQEKNPKVNKSTTGSTTTTVSTPPPSVPQSATPSSTVTTSGLGSTWKREKPRTLEKPVITYDVERDKEGLEVLKSFTITRYGEAHTYTTSKRGGRPPITPESIKTENGHVFLNCPVFTDGKWEWVVEHIEDTEGKALEHGKDLLVQPPTATSVDPKRDETVPRTPEEQFYEKFCLQLNIESTPRESNKVARSNDTIITAILDLLNNHVKDPTIIVKEAGEFLAQQKMDTTQIQAIKAPMEVRAVVVLAYLKEKIKLAAEQSSSLDQSNSQDKINSELQNNFPDVWDFKNDREFINGLEAIKGSIAQQRAIAIFRIQNKINAKTDPEKIINFISELEKAKIPYLHDRQGLGFSFDGHQWKGQETSKTWTQICKLAKNRVLELIIKQNAQITAVPKVQAFLGNHRFRWWSTTKSTEIFTLFNSGKKAQAQADLQKEQAKTQTWLNKVSRAGK